MRHKSKRDVERLVACLRSQPDIASSVRKLPAPARAGQASSPADVVTIDERESGPRGALDFGHPIGHAVTTLLLPCADPTRDAPAACAAARVTIPAPQAATSCPREPRTLVAPLSPDRYLLRVTLSQDAHDKLERARALLRHSVPSGDPAAIIDRALSVLVGHLEKTRLAMTIRPQRNGAGASSTRHVPAVVRRAVWARDKGRCAFVGRVGRCEEQQFLEFHHVTPFAEGGATDAANLQLRCRAHNAYEAMLHFGEEAAVNLHA